jgi:Mrp family chromosome partitioning ATPase
MNYAIALILGLLIPGLIILITDYFRNLVTSDDDVKYITDLPVAGQILHNTTDSKTSALADPKSHIYESFRGLRARLQYFIKNTPSPVVLITSSMPEEGKTFTSVNLAYICSLSGKKTVLVGFDLRSPKSMGRIRTKRKQQGNIDLSYWQR